MQTNQPRILLSEGSSLSAREVITGLGLAGHRLDLVSSEPMCLGRCSRFVRFVHRAPPSGEDPEGYLQAVLDVVARRRIDVLLPVHEQAYLFAAARHRLPAALGVALSDFASFEQVQSKAAFTTLLARLDVPQPATEVLYEAQEFRADRPFPFYVKTAFGNASTGVWRVGDVHERDALLPLLEARDAFVDGLIVQAAVAGLLERTQAVFDRGRLVASHIYRQVAEGPNGGDVLKISVIRPAVRALVERIGAALVWHGALSFDYIVEESTGTPHFFDANPRFVEPMNACLSGTDLPSALLQVSLGQAPPAQADGREGVLTRLGLMGLLAAAQRQGDRRDVLREAALLACRAGRYRGALEELTPMGVDPSSLVPLGVVCARLLLAPRSAARLSERTVKTYSLTPNAVHRLRGWTQASVSQPPRDVPAFDRSRQ